MHLVRLMLLPLLFMLAVQVAAEPQTPHEKVDAVTERLLALIMEAKDYFDEDPERYYNGVEKLLDPLIDFPSFTRSVMGEYGTRAYYQSLEGDEAKKTFRDNYARFVETFKTGLIHTYAKGLLAFNGQEIVVLPPADEDKANISAGETVEVKQRIDNDGESYTLIYFMRPDKNGKWLLRNVMIDTVNVGQLYRNQFASAMEKHEQDFAAVIDNWVEDARAADEQVQEQW